MFENLYSLIEMLPAIIQIVIFIVSLGGGVLLLIKGADVFVDGAAGLARRLKIPAVIIGMTIVSFGTSAPEAAVSIAAALSGNSDIALGNVVGSNICNILLVLGISSLFVPTVIRKKSVLVDLLVMVFAVIVLLTMFFVLPLPDGRGLIRWEGIILLLCILGYVIYNVLGAVKGKKSAIEPTETPKKEIKVWLALIILLAGLIGVIIGGELVTYGASNLAITFGLSEAIVGLTIVAVCTSLPELVATLVAARKKESDIALGNVIGSNIFNIFFILGMAATIAPFVINPVMLFDIVFALLVSLGVCSFYFIKGQITRRVGVVMLILYASYITYLVLVEFAIITY